MVKNAKQIFYLGGTMSKGSLGYGTSGEFFSEEFKELDLRDRRLTVRALNIFQALQGRLTTCVRRLYTLGSEARQAYDFFS
jgi:hypothetical protein